MAYENSAFPANEIPPAVIGTDDFGKIVAVELDGIWMSIANPVAALRVLREEWPLLDGPSYLRALSACERCIDGAASPAGARATFVVAAMEAEMRFEVFDDPMEFLEFEVAAAAADDVRSGDHDDI